MEKLEVRFSDKQSSITIHQKSISQTNLEQGQYIEEKRDQLKKYYIRTFVCERKATGLSGILKLNDQEDNVIKNKSQGEMLIYGGNEFSII